MINYREGKSRYKINELGSLYIDKRKISSNEQPIIYIGGQMEHRGHLIEQSGYTTDVNHNKYTGSWMYEYPVFSSNKKDINAKNFSENLLAALESAKLGEVILLTHSHGGLIGAYASKSELIDKVISVHPPILGTPLGNPEVIGEYRELLTKTQRLILALTKQIVNSEYGFEQDNFLGVDLSKVDLNKLLVVGNYLDIDLERNKLLLETYRIIERVLGLRSDGIVTFEPSEFEKLGINYMQTNENKNHFQSISPIYFDSVLKRVLNK